MKWMHRRRGRGTYTDYLTEFYSRSRNRYVEAYGDAYVAIRDPMVGLADLQPHDRVLDVATGGGYQAAAFARHGYVATGVDYVRDRVRLAAAQHRHPRLAWGAADAAHLPFGDKTFDIVTLSLALHDMPLPARVAALRELKRVARRRIVIVEPRAPDFWLWRQLYATLGELVDESIHFRAYALDRLEDALETAGLQLMRRQRCYHGILAIYVCDPG